MQAAAVAKIEDKLWSCILPEDQGCPSPGGSFDLTTLLRQAMVCRTLPEDAVMERLERKATIARAIHNRYSTEWAADRSAGLAGTGTLVGLAALFLIDAVSASDGARALKRANAACWIMQLDIWDAEAICAQEVYNLAQIVVAELTHVPTSE